MKARFTHLLTKPRARLWIAGAGGAFAGIVFTLLADAPWWTAPVTATGSTLAQWVEQRWTSHRMRLLLKARRRARMAAQLKGQA
ncbi:hypothetical protein [Polluticoccus soli]|uniref:hypothetical protein n=1 Tax=Polluticoccus soli TaxID=3034150 RepID=UPI0023E207B3|nr:hypothetical protein [Flavipsychrobacter sp. JY13-12]